MPETQETKLFSFLNPLAVEIWIFVFFAYCLVIGLGRKKRRKLLFLPIDINRFYSHCLRLSAWLRFRLPFGLWRASVNGVWQLNATLTRDSTRTISHCRIGEKFLRFRRGAKIKQNFIANFSPNSFWFVIGTLMQQGSDLNPKVNMLQCHFRGG